LKIEKLTFLGYSPINLPLLMDLCHETFKTQYFSILKNIASNRPPVINKKKEFYNFSFMEIRDLESNSQLVFGVTNPLAKQPVFQFFSESGLEMNFTNIVHPKSYIASSVVLASGILIEPLVSISSQSELTFGVTIKRGTTIGHHTKVEEFTTVNPGCTISGNVQIGKGCTIGSGTVLRDSISVGTNSIIGAGSNVTKDIPANVLAFGNPCRVMKQL
jgi:sugar O-acyltransferase (sialic acid O-acetyltransferase NeuD family)